MHLYMLILKKNSSNCGVFGTILKYWGGGGQDSPPKQIIEGAIAPAPTVLTI